MSALVRAERQWRIYRSSCLALTRAACRSGYWTAQSRRNEACRFSSV